MEEPGRSVEGVEKEPGGRDSFGDERGHTDMVSPNRLHTQQNISEVIFRKILRKSPDTSHVTHRFIFKRPFSGILQTDKNKEGSVVTVMFGSLLQYLVFRLNPVGSRDWTD